MSTLTELLGAEAPVELGDHEIAYMNVGLVRKARNALETLEWFAENAYSLKDRERAQKALGL